MQVFRSLSITLLVPLFWIDSARCFTTSSTGCPRALHINENERRSVTRCNEKPGWLDDAMEGIPSGDAFNAESYKNGIDLQPGIAGFSVDSELGFVSILVTNSDTSDDSNNSHWIPTVISPVDKDRPKSAEALTCVQLAGGLDLGTAILPPNSLAKLVADHNAEEEDTNNAGNDTVDARFSLTKVTALPNPNASEARICIEEETQEVVATTPERDQAILDAVPKVEKAVKTLPGLQETTTEEVANAVRRFADPKGVVDRTAFSSILDALREANSPSAQLASPLFRLEVSVIGEGGISQASIDTSNAMLALGLAMRYKVTVGVEQVDDHQEGGKGKDSLLERFPAFRPIQELSEDSKIIDGFIPSMFKKGKLDNDMKSD